MDKAILKSFISILWLITELSVRCLSQKDIEEMSGYIRKTRDELVEAWWDEKDRGDEE